MSPAIAEVPGSSFLVTLMEFFSQRVRDLSAEFWHTPGWLLPHRDPSPQISIVLASDLCLLYLDCHGLPGFYLCGLESASGQKVTAIPMLTSSGFYPSKILHSLLSSCLAVTVGEKISSASWPSLTLCAVC